eukprot:COSAG06_NODE_24577_length_658_cov_1.550984_1_plen_194_part_01
MMRVNGVALAVPWVVAVATLMSSLGAGGELIYDEDGTVLHVRATTAAGGDTSAAWDPLADGSAARPFHTIEAARDALRSRHLHTGGATVVIHGGVYGPLTLDPSLDSGRSGSPIAYVAAENSTAVLSGGVTVPRSAFRPWRGAVLRADLAALGITSAQLGSMNQSGAGLVNGCVNRKARLVLGDKTMTLARYPN